MYVKRSSVSHPVPLPPAPPALALAVALALASLGPACALDEASPSDGPGGDGRATPPDGAAPTEAPATQPPAPWVWPARYREADRGAAFGARTILAEVERRDADGEYAHRSLESLLATPLFTEHGPVSRGYAMYMRSSRGLFRNAPEGPVSPITPRAMAVVGTTVLTVQNQRAHADSFDKVEMIATDLATAGVDFYLLDLAASNPAERVQKNPSRCDGCHDRRFVWGMYPYWPGFQTGLPERRYAVARNFGRGNTISFSISLFELNMARIARSLLDTEAYYRVEKPVLAALLDCPLAQFPFHGDAAFQRARADMVRAYYQDARALIDDVNRTNGGNISYRIGDDGVLENNIVLNRYDPLRLALLETLLDGSGVDLHSWSISRRPREASWLFQTSGGISLSRLAFYLVANSRNAPALRALIPNIDELSYSEHPATPPAVCAALAR